MDGASWSLWYTSEKFEYYDDGLIFYATSFSLCLKQLRVGWRGVSTSTNSMKLKLTPDIPLDKRWPLMTSSFSLVTWVQYTYQKQNEEQIPSLSFIATILISNFARYVRVTKELHPWHHHGSQVSWIQFTDQIENEDQILYLNFYMHYWLQICQICRSDIRFEFMASS